MEVVIIGGVVLAGLALLSVGAVREAITLSKQNDIDAYVRTHYQKPTKGDGPLRIYGPSPFGLWFGRRLQQRRFAA